MSFSSFSLDDALQKSIVSVGYDTPTPIQQKVIPLVLQHQDVMAKAQTGSGKTASFVLPVLNDWLSQSLLKKQKKAKIMTLVLTPTRELTQQVADTFELFSQSFESKPKIVTVIGGESLGYQMESLQKGSDIVVATAGRLIEILNKKQIDLSHINYFVLDEADKMLDLGFVDELDVILQSLPQKRSNLFFSATYSTKVLDICSKISDNPIEVNIEEESLIVQNIHQRAIEVNHENRSSLLKHLIKTSKWDLVLVFMATKRACDNTANKFRKYGINAESFHGNLDQEERTYTLDDFKNKHINVLFATDIAARGLHIDDIESVINYDLPRSTSDYIHRIGRTARAGKKGEAISFVTHDNYEHFKLIEKRCELTIEKEQVEGFELKGERAKKVKGNAPIKGKRKSKKDKLREKNLHNKENLK